LKLEAGQDNVGETVIAPLLPPGEPLVVQPELVKNRCIKIMSMDRLIHGSKSKFIRRTIRHTPLPPPPTGSLP